MSESDVPADPHKTKDATNEERRGRINIKKRRKDDDEDDGG